MVVYRFPKDRLVYGPKQIVARINQDTEISRQVSLWDQRGSQVIQGTLLVIPVENSLIYVQPLYLRAETGKIPELKRVIVAYENKIAMEETLERALARIFGESAGAERVAAAAVAATARRRRRAAGRRRRRAIWRRARRSTTTGRSRPSATATGRSTARRSAGSGRSSGRCGEGRPVPGGRGGERVT